MKKLLWQFALVLLFVGLFHVPAQADTDYLCLNNCMQGGKASATCMPLCANDKIGNQKPKKTSTDYRCFSLCTNGGKSASSCLSQCTYSKSVSTGDATNGSGAVYAPPPLVGSTKTQSRNVLHAPVPAGDAYVPPSQAIQTTKPSKDYVCIAQCLHDGMQPELCNQNCAAVTPEFSGPK